jgi:hypothetical protein
VQWCLAHYIPYYVLLHSKLCVAPTLHCILLVAATYATCAQGYGFCEFADGAVVPNKIHVHTVLQTVNATWLSLPPVRRATSSASLLTVLWCLAYCMSTVH